MDAKPSSSDLGAHSTPSRPPNNPSMSLSSSTTTNGRNIFQPVQSQPSNARPIHSAASRPPQVPGLSSSPQRPPSTGLSAAAAMSSGPSGNAAYSNSSMATTSSAAADRPTSIRNLTNPPPAVIASAGLKRKAADASLTDPGAHERNISAAVASSSSARKPPGQSGAGQTKRQASVVDSADDDRMGSADEDGVGGGSGSGSTAAARAAARKAKRNRVHFSCVECHRRKQKCDRQEPCGQCIARKVPNLCRPFINGVEDPAAYDADVKARLGRIEEMLAQIMPRLSSSAHDIKTESSSSATRHHAASSPSPASSTAPSPRPKRPMHSDHNRHVNMRSAAAHHHHAPHHSKRDREGWPTSAHLVAPSMEGILQRNGSEEVFHPRSSHVAAGPGSPSAVGARVVSGGGAGSQDPTVALAAQPSPAGSHATPPVPLYMSLAHTGVGSGYNAGSPTSSNASTSGLAAGGTRAIRITLDPPSAELTEILETLSESGITKDVLIGLLSGIPEKTLSDSLVELYFREIDWTRYKLNRPAFTRRYAQFFDTLQRDPQNPHLDSDTIKWLPLYFILIAVATLSAPSEMVGGPNGQKAWSRRFYGSSRSAMTCAKALQKDNLDIVFAGLLTARFMLLTRRAAEGSTPLTSAYQLGLYRDGTVLNLTDKREIEFRRRAWAMVYHLDRTTALLVGRPTSISDNHTDTKEPANLDDEEVEAGDFDPAGHTLSQPTEYTQVILRHRLAEIMGKISDHTFAIRPPEYSTVLKLDQELLAWQSNLPDFFAINSPDTSLDAKYHYIFVQRHLLACEFLFARITLHRPYLLRKRDRDNQYLYSREAAIESAKADLLGRRAFMFEKPVDLKVNSGGYRVLNSYIVLGVAIKLEPNTPRADELRRLLDVVAGLAPDEQGRISEPIVKDELAIVEFLTQKAKTGEADTNNSAPVPPYSHVLPDNQKAPSSNKRESFGLAAAASNAERRGPASDPAWSFVAPEMATIDVHQPFSSNGSSSGQLPVPGPLRPPQRERLQSASDGGDLRYGDMAPPAAQTSSSSSVTRPSPRMTAANGSEFSMESLNAAFPNGQLATDGQDNWWNENWAALGIGHPANSSTTGDMGFNPFALAQFGQAEEISPEASETAFLNLLLSTIANNGTA